MATEDFEELSGCREMGVFRRQRNRPITLKGSLSGSSEEVRRSGFGWMALCVAAAFFMAGRAGYFLHAGDPERAAVSAGFAVIDLLVATVIGVVLLSGRADQA